VFAIVLTALGVVLSVTAVLGPFTVDDNNYLVNVLALRHARVSVANTEGLPPSQELLFFDPGPTGRRVDTTPVTSSAPPLYAPMALPFSFGGWRGLVLLNTLAFLATVAMVFLFTQRYAKEDAAPWFAAVAFAIGGFGIEYAQGVWPHSLSVMLCFAGIALVCIVLDGADARLASVSGFCLALAAGVRYQNALLVAGAGPILLLWSWRRLAAVIWYVLGAAPPLVVSAAINHARLGSWNPISKGPGYLSVEIASASAWYDPIRMFWARLVDMSVRPPLLGADVEGWVTYDPGTGAHLMLGVIPQKALLQSAPWAALGLLMFIVAWRRQPVDGRVRSLRIFGLLTALTLAVFAVSGVRRHEGLTFNQRYLLEIVPLLAVGGALALDGLRLCRRTVNDGLLFGALIAGALLTLTPALSSQSPGMWLGRMLVLFYGPLLIGLALVTLWLLAWHAGRARAAFALVAGAAVGWAFVVHVAEDVTASHRVRRANLSKATALRAVLPDHSGLLVHAADRDALGPLLFDKDIVVIDVSADDGLTTQGIVDELMRQRRRVFAWGDRLPVSTILKSRESCAVVPLASGGDFCELPSLVK